MVVAQNKWPAIISGFQWGDISRPINGVIAVISLFMTGRGPPCRVGDVLKKKGIDFYRSN